MPDAQRPRLSDPRLCFGSFPPQAHPDLAVGRAARSFAALRGRLAHDDLSIYNAVQKLLYLGILVAGVIIVLSGLSIWKPVQLQWLTDFFGGYDTARYVHFAAMAAIVAFLVVHVLLGACWCRKACARWS